jgi:hypothetical protein
MPARVNILPAERCRYWQLSSFADVTPVSPLSASLAGRNSGSTHADDPMALPTGHSRIVRLAKMAASEWKNLATSHTHIELTVAKAPGLDQLDHLSRKIFGRLRTEPCAG